MLCGSPWALRTYLSNLLRVSNTRGTGLAPPLVCEVTVASPGPACASAPTCGVEIGNAAPSGGGEQEAVRGPTEPDSHCCVPMVLSWLPWRILILHDSLEQTVRCHPSCVSPRSPGTSAGEVSPPGYSLPRWVTSLPAHPPRQSSLQGICSDVFCPQHDPLRPPLLPF